MNDQLIRTRAELSQITSDIVDLMRKRFKILFNILRLKRKMGLPLCDPTRESEILNEVENKVHGDEFGPTIIRLVEQMLSDGVTAYSSAESKMQSPNDKSLPIIYSCSGCSSAAQMANYIAIRMDREGLAEMSCIAGVGGGVKPLVAKAKSGRKIIAIDGCPLKCSEHCLKQQGLSPNAHVVLSDYKISKKQHQDFRYCEANPVVAEIQETIRNL